ncbi:MAG: hypothetical protein ACRDSF_18955, partial [Pseudonocardiaceae bacterium]
HISIHGECHLKLAEADHAVSYSQQSLETLDRSFARDVAMTIVDLGEAYAQCNEIDEAARLLGDAGDIAPSFSLGSTPPIGGAARILRGRGRRDPGPAGVARGAPRAVRGRRRDQQLATQASALLADGNAEWEQWAAGGDPHATRPAAGQPGSSRPTSDPTVMGRRVTDTAVLFDVSAGRWRSPKPG